METLKELEESLSFKERNKEQHTHESCAPYCAGVQLLYDQNKQLYLKRYMLKSLN